MVCRFPKDLTPPFACRVGGSDISIFSRFRCSISVQASQLHLSSENVVPLCSISSLHLLEHQRRSAGAMLLIWAMERAAKEGAVLSGYGIGWGRGEDV